MDACAPTGVQNKKVSKKSKPKNNPVKVVYISNPMKVMTSASEFRALVQELTGQDAELPPDPTRFSDQQSGGEYVGRKNQRVSGSQVSTIAVHEGEGHENDAYTLDSMPEMGRPSQDQQPPAAGSSSDERFDTLDDVFTTQMIDTISGLSPATVSYESAQVEHVL